MHHEFKERKKWQKHKRSCWRKTATCQTQPSREAFLLYQELNGHFRHFSLLPLFLGECLFNVTISAKRLRGVFTPVDFSFLTIKEGRKSSNKVQSTLFGAANCQSYDHTCTHLKQAAKPSKPLSYYCCALRIHKLVGGRKSRWRTFFFIWLNKCTGTDAPVKVVIAQKIPNNSNVYIISC